MIEVWVESCSKGMYACGGQGMSCCSKVYGCGALVVTYVLKNNETTHCRREGSRKW